MGIEWCYDRAQSNGTNDMKKVRHKMYMRTGKWFSRWFMWYHCGITAMNKDQRSQVYAELWDMFREWMFTHR